MKRRLFDVDEKFMLRAIEIARFGMGNVAPNPMAANTKVNFESTTSMKGKIEIVNILGAVTFSETIQIVNGNNSININTENITSGIYFLKITSENKTLSTIKVVK